MPSLAPMMNEATTSLENGIDVAVNVVGVGVMDWQAASELIREHTINGKCIFIITPFVAFNGSVNYATP